jgi:rubrerythrin
MGDYKNHSAETGIGLCNSFADLKKANRAKEGEMRERSRLDLKMRKFVHYATRYKEHLSAVNLDHKRGEQLITQIDFIISKSGNKYIFSDFLFLNEIIELVCKTRRVLANTYSMRFFMRGKRKKAFFDFIQADLELSLESLSQCLVKDITEYIEMGADKSISLKEEFYKFKAKAGQTRNAVETHFTKILASIKNDFPEVKDEEGKEDEDSSDDEGGPSKDANVEWTCYICTTRNGATTNTCPACNAPRNILFTKKGK